MKKTKSMYYNPTENSRELYLFADNNERVYTQSIIPIIKCLKKKVNKGIYDEEKAVIAFYRVSNFANDLYRQCFGESFSVNERYNCAIELLSRYREDIDE